MTVNKLNSVENFIIHQLSGTNLNQPGQVWEDFSLCANRPGSVISQRSNYKMLVKNACIN